MTRLILVPSPFVGAVSWQAAADALPDALAVDYGGVSGPDWYEAVARRIGVQADGRPWIAVLHSGAGGFAPALASAAADLAGFIFVDAVLPYPGRSNIETAPQPLADRLRALATDGRLAPWNRWFDADPLPRLIPDPEMRAAFERDLPRVPFAFLEAVSPAGSEWERLPSAYLQLSKTYDATADKAEQRGWPVRRARLHHLAMASHPAVVADLLLETAPPAKT
jgi:hypothetical protein